MKKMILEFYSDTERRRFYYWLNGKLQNEFKCKMSINMVD